MKINNNNIDMQNMELEVWKLVSKHDNFDSLLVDLKNCLVSYNIIINDIIVKKFYEDASRIETFSNNISKYSSISHIDHVLSGSEKSILKRLSKKSTIIKYSTNNLADKEIKNPLNETILKKILPKDLLEYACIMVLDNSINTSFTSLLLISVKDCSHLNNSKIEGCMKLIKEPIEVFIINQEKMHEISRQKKAAEADNFALLSRLGRKQIVESIIGENSGLKSVMARVSQVATTDTPVLILGETGSGKEVIARAIHNSSKRSSGPIVRVNCGAIPSELIDSELFGHEKGSFTGAINQRKGWFERADGGTLFLDEVGELPMAAQVRLLRILQDGTLERVGGQSSLTVDVRIIAATNRNMKLMVDQNMFRNDLWYRISTFSIYLPPLRERIQDIEALALYFSERVGIKLWGTPLLPTKEDLRLLMQHNWPGNVRELSSTIERAALLGDGEKMEIKKALHDCILLKYEKHELEKAFNSPEKDLISIKNQYNLHSTQNRHNSRLEKFDNYDISNLLRDHIQKVLKMTHGRIEGPHGAAAVLNINPQTLRGKMRRLNIKWSEFKLAK